MERPEIAKLESMTVSFLICSIKVLHPQTEKGQIHFFDFLSKLSPEFRAKSEQAFRKVAGGRRF